MYHLPITLCEPILQEQGHFVVRPIPVHTETQGLYRDSGNLSVDHVMDMNQPHQFPPAQYAAIVLHPQEFIRAEMSREDLVCKNAYRRCISWAANHSVHISRRNFSNASRLMEVRQA